MDLYIAEKPSLGRIIADHLVKSGGDSKRHRTHIEGEGWVVTWCFGHLFELFAPGDYDAAYERWSIESLPIIPEVFKHKPIEDKKAQIKAISTLAAKASRVIHTGDPDQEGQYLVDIVIRKAGYKGDVLRLWPNDLSETGLNTVFDQIKPNSDYLRLSQSAQERSVADWIVGLNLTRLYTINARSAGHDGVVSLGRVQSPTLGLVCRRCHEIDNFTSVEHYVGRITAEFTGKGSAEFTWQPTDQHVDESKRVLHRTIVDTMLERVRGGALLVTGTEHKKKRERPPLPYALPSLQTDANKRLGFAAQTVLDVAQYLYEEAKLITYPRSDCQYLSEGDFAQAEKVARNALKWLPEPSRFDAIDTSSQPRCYSDKITKAAAHTAIVPTAKPFNVEDLHGLSPSALKKISPQLTEASQVVELYQLIVERFLGNFLPDHEYLTSVITGSCARETFVAKGRQTLVLGWKCASGAAEEADGKEDEDERSEQSLPNLEKNEEGQITDGIRLTRQTKPPAYFTEGTLIKAMSNIALYVTDPKIKEVLKDTDGIGTPATQSQIIETLKRRGYIDVANRGRITASSLGKSLYEVMPEFLKEPSMTAVWELGLRRIKAGENDAAQFRSGVVGWATECVEALKASPPKFVIQGATDHPHDCGGFFRKRKSTKGVAFWVCSKCDTFRPNYRNKPAVPLKGDGNKCPECGNGTLITRVRKQQKKGVPPMFLACNAYPDCKHVERTP